MQDIKEAEADSVAALNDFLDAELDYYERCAEELRRARETLSGPHGGTVRYGHSSPPRVQPTRPAARSRSNTARSWQDPRPNAVYEEPEHEPAPPRLRNAQSGFRAPPPPPPPQSSRPPMARSSTMEGRHLPRSTAAPPLPLTRVRTDGTAYGGRDDVFADDASTASGSGSPDMGERSLSPATSYGSLNRSTTALGAKKAPPPPPPVNRAKKPGPPPVPARKDHLGY